VQTLSRLNRTAPGKEDTFVLDFVNEREGIRDAFEHFQGKARKGEDSDPHRPNELQHELEEFRLFGQADVDAFCEVWFRGRAEPTPADHQAMNAAVEARSQPSAGWDRKRATCVAVSRSSGRTGAPYGSSATRSAPSIDAPATGRPATSPPRDAQRLWPGQAARQRPYKSASDHAVHTLAPLSYCPLVRSGDNI
jgi:hypothetical protein